MKKVTIILPCYNVEKYIEEAFKTILKQSRIQEFIVIPVDDCSKDGTREIIKKYEELHPEIFQPIYREASSGGPSKPRNEALDKTTTPYVIFMDPDDRIFKDGYSVLLDKIEELGSDLVIGTRVGVPEFGNFDDKIWYDFNDIRYVNEKNTKIMFDLLVRRPVILKSIYRTSIINENNMRFNENIKVSEDEIFDMDYIICSSKITKINDVVYLYTVQRTDSITTKINLSIYRDLDETYTSMKNVLIKYFDERAVDLRIWGLIRSFYLPKIYLTDESEQLEALKLIADYVHKEKIYDKDVYRYPADYFYLESFKNNKLIELRDDICATQEMKQKKGKQPEKSSLLKKLKKTSLSGLIFIMLNSLKKFESGDHWVFEDREDKASDNAEALYKYVQKNKPNMQIYFIIDKKSKDYKRLIDQGFNVLKKGSLQHYVKLFTAKYFITSHVDNKILLPWKFRRDGLATPFYKLIFLQHGVIRSDLSSWLGTKNFHIFCTSAFDEYQGILNNTSYMLNKDHLKLTGLARHDLLSNDRKDYVVIFPTWRSYLLNEQDPKSTEFVQNWIECVEKMSKTSKLKVKIVLHSSLGHIEHIIKSEIEDRGIEVEFIEYANVESFSKLISNSAMLVTDYSSISFDFLYVRKNVIYFNFKETQTHSTNVNADLSIYEKLGWRVENIPDLLDTFSRIQEQDFQLSKEKEKRIKDFFAYNDTRNCERIYNEIIRKESQKGMVT